MNHLDLGPHEALGPIECYQFLGVTPAGQRFGIYLIHVEGRFAWVPWISWKSLGHHSYQKNKNNNKKITWDFCKKEIVVGA